MVSGPQTDDAMVWLLGYLRDGAKYATDVIDAAAADGVSLATLRIAKRQIGVESRKEAGQGGQWFWRLPDDNRVPTVPPSDTQAEHANNGAACVDRLLRAQDIATVFGVKRSRAHELMTNGTLPSIRIGRSVRVSQKSLERWIAQQEARPDNGGVA